MKNREIISKLTLEEKVSLLSGANFWNTKAITRLDIPSMMLTDGPHGVRKQAGKADHLGLNESIPTTCFPPAATLANSWDTELAQEVGRHLGKEAAANQVGVLLGPGMNIKRNPLCGRNFEYFSEDPYLTGKMAAAMTFGIQEKGVSACPKHFAVNSQEHLRMSINEVTDERALREIYLEGFRYAICEAKPKTIMTSYNQVNGVFANENEHLLQDILCGEWGFDGVVVTDWGGEADRVKGLIAGNHLEMPSSAGLTDQEIIKALENGTMTEELLDKRVDDLLSLVLEGQESLKGQHTYDQKIHHEFARKVARNSIVLLQNENKVLPLPTGKKVSIIGDFAKTPRYQGAGSSLINPTATDCALDTLAAEELEIVGYSQGFKRYGGKSVSLQNEALELVKKSEVVLLFLGLDESSEAEGIDRSHMNLPKNQIDLLEKLSEVTKDIIVVLSGGSPIEMPWRTSVSAILHTYLGGQASGGAIADVIVGRYNPSGKLAETYPKHYEDIPSAPWYPGQQTTSEHRESIFVGYRYFDTAAKQVAWPFGYGLSYTTFAYSNLVADAKEVRFTIENTGDRMGEEIAQVYIENVNSKVFCPKKELKGFVKIALAPKEKREVIIALDDHAFSYFNVVCNTWVEEGGDYKVMVGASSRDIRLMEKLTLADSLIESPYDSQKAAHYYAAEIDQVSAEEFEYILGSKLPEATWDIQKPLGYHDTLGQGKYKKGIGCFIYHLISFVRKMCFKLGHPLAANNVIFVMNLPFLRMARMSGGRIDYPMLDGILTIVNGSFIRGTKETLRAMRNKKSKKKG